MTDESAGPKKAVKKRVRPYPFDGSVEVNAVKKPLEIMHLTQNGFIARLKQGLVFVGEYYQAILELPVSHNFVNNKVRVIKTYDRAVDPKKGLVDRMAEFHFEALSDQHKKYILEFLAAIGQK